ncbi:FAS1 domain-containing protein [Parasitella parasitica]|nr:FAS1 domain-containing protein [Parasitella parasitica]
MMKLLLLLVFLQIIHAQSLINSTILESLKSISPLLYKAIQSSPLAPELTDLLHQNITLFLPADTALNASIESGKLNFSSNAYGALSFLTLNGSHYATTFSAARKFYTTNSNNQISIGPTISANYQTQSDKYEIYAGLTKAKIVSQDIQCSNGLIHMVDNFLQPAETPLDTISDLDELEYMEGLLKSLNVSDTVSGLNKTILAPINEAWVAANGSALPFGTLIHNLKYLVIDGLYTSDMFLTGEPISYLSDYKKLPIVIQLQQDKVLVNGAACIVKTDIMTSCGIIHLIDSVPSADAMLELAKNTSAIANTTSSNGDASNTTTSKMPFHPVSIAHRPFSISLDCVYLVVSFVSCLCFL